jgi:hypothetical protein
MTIAERIRIEVKREIELYYVSCLLQKGYGQTFIASAFKLPRKKVEEIIQKIEAESSE